MKEKPVKTKTLPKTLITVGPEISTTGEKYEYVGKSIPRVDSFDKVRGKTLYASDLKLEGMLFARILRSKYPHAIIKNINTDKAKTLSGVVSVITYKDVPGINRMGPTPMHQSIITGDKVRFIGDALALVAAKDEETASRAIELIDVKYEVLPGVYDPLKALEEDAPKVHDSGNLMKHLKVRKGNTDESFKDCDVVIENIYKTPLVDHAYLEIESALAFPSPDGIMNIWAPTQDPFQLRRVVAKVLGVDVDKVRLMSSMTGGGFGGKSEASYEVASRAALLALASKRPVKLVATREESLVSSTKRHPMIIYYKTGAKKDGTLIAVEARIYMDKGAYNAGGGNLPPASMRGLVHAGGPYVVPNVKIDMYCVFTNNPYGGQMRGPGCPQVTFAYESQMNELAEKLSMDPLELRLRNGLDKGSITVTSQVLNDSVGLKETLHKASNAATWRDKRKEKYLTKDSGDIRQGVGIACCWFGVGKGSSEDSAGAYIYITPEGKFKIACGAMELGQGSFTSLAQIASEELGVCIDDVQILQPDTDVDPDSSSSTSSRITTLVGNAIIRGAINARNYILKKVADNLSLDKDILKIEKGKIVSLKGEEVITLKKFAPQIVKDGRKLVGFGFWVAPKSDFDPEKGYGRAYAYYAFGTQIAEVEVDARTGQVQVKKMIACHDVGKAINPSCIEGQIEGGISMGMGFCLTESLKLKDGIVLNPSLTDYLIPSSMDMPEIESIIVEDTNNVGPFGAKGVGEPPNVPTAPAIADAIYNATGVRIRELPITPEKIISALKEKGDGDH